MEMEDLRMRLGALQHQHEQDEGDEEDDGDDTRSVGTVRMGGGRGRRRYDDDDAEEHLEDADEEEEGEVRDQERSNGSNGVSEGSKERGERLGRPSTPEPTGRTSDDDDDEEEDPVKYSPSNKTSPRAGSEPQSPHLYQQTEEEHQLQLQLHEQLQSQISDTQTILLQNQALTSRLDSLGSELGSALELSRSLQAQHAEALSTVSALTGRVLELEGKVVETEGKWEFWKGKMEEVWRKEREVWESERERMRSVVKEWEEAKRRAEEEEEERRLNEDGEDDEWTGTQRGSSSSSHLGGQDFLTSNRNSKNLSSRTGSSSPTPNSSPNPKSNYSSLRSLLNPLYSTPSRSSGAHPQRGSVPSSFIRSSTSSPDGNSLHPLRKSTSSSTIKGPGGGGDRSLAARVGREKSFDGTEEEEEGEGEDEEDQGTITGLGENKAPSPLGNGAKKAQEQAALNVVS
ncbi:hypothetical protein BDY24DRAFT_279521 [Mrakia frigida]|uniref:uncharacterized protein n=1 Tax=Mrakia frigida TaxID=29902 RepID=UPI003FCC25CA